MDVYSRSNRPKPSTGLCEIRLLLDIQYVDAAEGIAGDSTLLSREMAQHWIAAPAWKAATSAPSSRFHSGEATLHQKPPSGKVSG